mmetsp:Transcript_6483/g.17512  ORF Transcript_6483/g.17512 Transcript_6483/m.17512 type:complete len:351 (-) Transcript_6483:57-1109(-)
MDAASAILAGPRAGGGSSSSSGGAAWRSSGGGRAGALHPELRSRLQKLGIAIPGLRGGGGSPEPTAATAAARAAPAAAERASTATAAAGDAAPARASDGEAPAARPQQHGTASADGSLSGRSQLDRGGQLGDLGGETEDASPRADDAHAGLDPGLDDLLLQLGDLDARSKALQKQGEAMLRQGSTSEPPRKSGGGGREQRGQDPKGEAPAPEGSAAHARHGEGAAAGGAGAGEGAGTDAPDEASAARSVARHHPLQGLPLSAQQQRGDDFQRARQRRSERPPVAPTTPGSSSARCSGRRCRKTFAASSPSASPTSARGPRTSCVALPPLKPSSSAPGRLTGESSWVPRRR